MPANFNLIASCGGATQRRSGLVLLLAVLVAGPARSEPPAILSESGGRFTLSLPYVEFGSGIARRAYTASLSSTSLSVFDLDTAVLTPVQPGSVDPARLEPDGAMYRLALPYLEYRSAGVTRAYSASLSSSDLARFVVEADSVRERALRAPDGPGDVRLSEVDTRTVGGRSFGSSSRLHVSWTAAGTGADHIRVTATDSVTGTQVGVQAAATANSVTLSGLKAATAYSVMVTACADAACARASSAEAVSASTAPEYWQLQGTGSTVATLLQPVADGNARLSATRFGPEAGANANTVQFYYGPRGVTGQAVATSGVVTAGVPSSYLSFTSLAASSGLRSPAAAGVGIKSIMTGQGVPLSASLGAKVRLFFESNDADGKTRIYSVDSVDGYLGRDFNSGAATVCSSSADYAPSGPCAATLVIGVEGDGVNANAKFTAARQNKLAWPTQTDWRWDGAAGAFLVFTVDAIAGCSAASHNHAYAVWNGSRFVVQYGSDGCPRMFKSAQAALPMHIGGARYKLYFGDPSLTAGRSSGSPLPFVGPKKLIYADGASSGAVETVEFEDWESVTQARNVHFLWPSGELLNDTAEGYIDDFHFLAPTGSLDLQVLFLSITDGTVTPFAAAAVLLNP